jgi:type II secretory pathway pseudopilin PulG
MVELLVVLAVVAMLLSLVTPRYFHQVDKAKEAALRENLAAVRLALDQFYGDKGIYPASLSQLVEERYLRRLPLDPMTNSSSTWEPVLVKEGEAGGIYDIKSGASGLASDKTAFNSW